jgi:hypothetical protein
MPPWSQIENRQGWTPTLPYLPVQVPAGVAGETERKGKIMRAFEETWNLFTRTGGYAAVPDTATQAKALESINGLTFRAMSIGGPHGQVAIIPLDESSEERGRLASYAPEMARMLLSVWHDEYQREELELLLIKTGTLSR